MKCALDDAQHLPQGPVPISSNGSLNRHFLLCHFILWPCEDSQGHWGWSSISFFFFFIYFLTFILFFYFLTLQYCIGLPYINMNPPQVYTCSPSWTLLTPPSPYHPSESSQGTSPKHPVYFIISAGVQRWQHIFAWNLQLGNWGRIRVKCQSRDQDALRAQQDQGGGYLVTRRTMLWENWRMYFTCLRSHNETELGLSPVLSKPRQFPH